MCANWNVIERSLVMCAGTTLDAVDIKMESAPWPRQQGAGDAPHFLPDGLTLDQYEQEIIREACGGSMATRARLRGC